MKTFFRFFCEFSKKNTILFLRGLFAFAFVLVFIGTFPVELSEKTLLLIDSFENVNEAFYSGCGYGMALFLVAFLFVYSLRIVYSFVKDLIGYKKERNKEKT